MSGSRMLVASVFLSLLAACGSCGERGGETPSDMPENAAVKRARLQRERAARPKPPDEVPHQDPPITSILQLDSGIPPLPVPTRPGDPRLARSLFDPPVTVTSTKWDYPDSVMRAPSGPSGPSGRLER